MTRALLILNPGSRAGRSQHQWAPWIRALNQADWLVAAQPTTSLQHARELAAAADPYDTVVAVGGDGTISAVISGVMERPAPRPRVGVLYAGTSPDFCRFHGLPTTPAAAVEALIGGEARPIDLVKITFHSREGRPQTAHVACSVNVGLGPPIARRANRWRPWCGDALGTALAAIWSICRHPTFDATVTIDGHPQPLTGIANLAVMKNPHIASGLRCGLALTPTDGRLGICAVYGRGRAGLLALLPAFYCGTISHRVGVTLETCKRVSVRAREEVEIEFDGDPQGYLPIDVAIKHEALRLIIPR